MNEKHDILETHPHLVTFFSFLDNLKKESDRGSVLIAATFLDEVLAQILHSYLISGKSSKKLLDGFNAPLGSFSSKIEACSALGLITEVEYGDIEIIRKIRNDFAHSIEISFESQRIRDLCSKLQYSAKSYDEIIVDAKGQFTTAATAVMLNLANRPHYVSKSRLTSRVWAY